MSTTPRAPGSARRTTALVAASALLLALGACSDDVDEPSDDTSPAAASDGPTYSTTAFVVPFDVTVPEWLPADVAADESSFVTWAPESLEEPAVRFLVPVNVYRPGDSDATPPPEDYLAYLLSQGEQGAMFTDTTETTVDGQPATLVTATSEDPLEGSLGCPADGVAAGDCFGIQPELALRIAVIEVDDTTLLAWLRHGGAGDTEAAAEEFAAFEEMLATVTFRDEAPPTPDETSEPASATAIDGTWTTSFTKGELADSPLLTDPEELNDQNWGDFTFVFDAGGFSFNQSNKKAEYASSGTFTVEGDVVRLDLDNGEKFAVRYSIHGAKLRFEPDESLGVAPTPYVLKPWTRTQAG